MPEKLPIGDHPSEEATQVLLVATVNQLIEDEREDREVLREIAKDMAVFKTLQREQNSNVAKVMDSSKEFRNWINKHNDWHGEEDKRVAARLNKAAGRQEILITQWKFIVFLLSTGILGAIAGKIGNLLGWW